MLRAGFVTLVVPKSSCHGGLRKVNNAIHSNTGWRIQQCRKNKFSSSSSSPPSSQQQLRRRRGTVPTGSNSNSTTNGTATRLKGPMTSKITTPPPPSTRITNTMGRKDLYKNTGGGANNPASGATIWQRIKKHPIEYMSIPCVAAFVGITTNWMGVKMLFYPIEYLEVVNVAERWPYTPYGFFGWQGVVPTKTVVMAQRLTDIVTKRLLSLEEAFGRIDPDKFSELTLPIVRQEVTDQCGPIWANIVNPVLPLLLPYLLRKLRDEIGDVLDLESVVLNAFVRDKEVLVDLFQKVGRVELEFLVNSGFGFGFILGLAQMVAWAARPAVFWTLPVAGALVGYVTNWIAIKLIFEPAEPYELPFTGIEIQGLFESRQVEVSDEFGDFMNQRVLNSTSLLQDLSNGGDQGELFAFLRRHLPSIVVPSHVLSAAVSAIAKIAQNPKEYPEIHQYVTQQLDIDKTLASRLKVLSSTDFEDLLHPVFQEDEIILIATGGVLGYAAGLLQTQLGWGGPGATRKAIWTIVFTLLSSFALYSYEKYEELTDEPIVSTERPQLQRRVTVARRVTEPLEEQTTTTTNTR